MPDGEDIRREWEISEIAANVLADKHKVKLGTLKSRKSREGWSRDPTNKDATKKEKVASVEPIIDSNKLNDKQKMFCLYYLKYFNATKAYQKAYECDYDSAMRSGNRLLRNVEIKKEIDRLRKEKQEGIFLDAQSVLQKYIDIAFADITDFVEFGTIEKPEYDEDGEPILDPDGNHETRTVSFVDFKDYRTVDGTIITEVKQGRDGVSVKLADKMKALEFLAKYTDLLSEKDKKRLEEEKLKADIAVSKSKVPNQNKVDMNKQIVALADLINNPAPNRVIDDE